MVTNMQLLKSRKVRHRHRAKDCTHDLLSAGFARATGFVERLQHALESSACSLRACRSGSRRHRLDGLHLQKGFPSDDALEHENTGDRANEERHRRKFGRSTCGNVRRFFHDPSNMLGDLGRRPFPRRARHRPIRAGCIRGGEQGSDRAMDAAEGHVHIGKRTHALSVDIESFTSHLQR